jgi:hypothetical protein
MSMVPKGRITKKKTVTRDGFVPVMAAAKPVLGSASFEVAGAVPHRAERPMRPVDPNTPPPDGDPSPARSLQKMLASDFDVRPLKRRWSRRATLGFIVLTCGSFWALVVFAVVRLLGR